MFCGGKGQKLSNNGELTQTQQGVGSTISLPVLKESQRKRNNTGILLENSFGILNWSTSKCKVTTLSRTLLTENANVKSLENYPMPWNS